MYGTPWANNQQKYRLSFTKTCLKLAISYLLDNCHFTLGCISFHQMIESRVGHVSLVGHSCGSNSWVKLCMGSDSTPFMENLILNYYEKKKFLQTKKQVLQRAYIFSNIFRLIDVLSTFKQS